MRSIAVLCLGAVATALLFAALPVSAQDAPRPAPKPILAWAAKPAKLPPFAAPNRPIWRLSELLARHKGQKDWTQTVVNTRDFIGEYISMGPGEKTKTVFYADDRVFWIIQSGQIRFTIEGQEPFVASKGFTVQVPERLQYSMETVGDEPSLRFEVRPSGEAPQYPLSETPTPQKGVQWVQATYTGHGDYDKLNRPYYDFYKDVIEGGHEPPAYVVKDDHTGVEILRSPAVPTPPPTDWGHMHENFPEFWYILEGKNDFLIEGVKPFTAEQGDIVFAPSGYWHRVTSAGTGMASRMPIIPRPGNLHWYQPGAGGD